MIVLPKGLDNDIIDSSDSSITSALLLDASPAYLGSPTGVLVEPPTADLDHQVPALGEIELRFWKGTVS